MVVTKKENASNNGSVSPTLPPPSTRMICLPDDDRIDPRLVRDQRAAEDEILRALAGEILVRKIRPSSDRDTAADDAAVSKLAIWLRAMLLGPASPLNKRANFAGDILRSTELMADVEIYYETLSDVVDGGASIVERNRADITKRSVYPDPHSTLRVREDVVRNKCTAMVTHFANLLNVDVRDAAAIERGVEYLYDYYIHSLTSGTAYPSATYNTYTGMAAMTMDAKFLNDSEDIVSYGLGITSVPPRALVSVTYAPPPYHAILVYISTLCACMYNLPTLHSIDEYATISTFTHGGPLGLSPLLLSSIRLSFATLSIVVTIYKIRNGRPFKIVRLPGSKLPGGTVDMLGWRTQGFYTSWAWNLLGMAFFLGGLIPLLIVCHDSGMMMMIMGKEEEKIRINPWLPRLALVTFEIAAPSAFLTSFIVTYGLWPQGYKQHGPSGTVGFKGPINLIQHNGNIAMVLFEVLLMSGLPVMLGHIVFAILFGLLYIAFIWCMIHRWSPKKGPVFPYFFLDTTLGIRTTLFMIALMTVMGTFFVLFALLDKCIAMIEERDYGVVPNLCCIALVSFILMKFKD